MTRPLLIAGVLSALACGSSSPKSTGPDTGPAIEDTKAVGATNHGGTTSNETPEPGSTGPKVAISPSPISLPNAVLYDGYILGGLPTKENIDSAVEQGSETAMSLMASDEKGISEVGPYAASKGFRYIRFTIAGKDDLTESMAWQFASTLPLLEKPAIVHSAKGHRVAAIFALVAYFVDELPAEEALAIGKAIGMGDLEAHVRDLMELPAS